MPFTTGRTRAEELLRLDESLSRGYNEKVACNEHGLTISPREGDAILFYNVKHDDQGGKGGTTQGGQVREGSRRGGREWVGRRPPNRFGALVPDERSKHAGCPLFRGAKYIATVWLHSTPINETLVPA